MADSKIETEVVVTGADKASAELNKVGEAGKKLGAGLDQGAKAVKGTEDNLKKASVNVGQFGSSVGLAGQAVGKLSPALGQLTTMAGSSLGAIQSLTTAGLGPMGLAVAGISLAISAGTALYAAYNEKQAQLAEAAKKAQDALIEQARAIDTVSQSIKDELAIVDAIISRESERSALRTRQATLNAGGFSIEIQQAYALEKQAAEQAAQVALRDANRELAASSREEDDSEYIELQRKIWGLTQDLTDAERQYDIAIQARGVSQARAAQQAIDDEKARLKNKFGRQDRPSSAAGPSAETIRFQEQLEANRAYNEAVLQEDIRSNNARKDTELAARAARREMEAADSNARKDTELAAQANRDALAARQNAAAIAELDKQNIAKQERDKKRAKTESDILSVSAGAHKLLGDVIEASAGSSAKSQKAAMQAAAAVSAIDSGINAAVEVARAAASYPDVAGMASHGFAAAAFTVAAAKAAAQAGGAGGDTGGASAAAPATSSPGGGPSGGSSGGGERGGDTVIINWGSAGLVYAADKAQLGRDIDNMIQASRSRLGRR